jgi:hypothetical protein
MPPKWPLPEKGSKVPGTTITLEHADYTASKDLWEFYRHSDELTGGYAASVETYTSVEDVPDFETTYLIPHIRENDIDFPRRVASARPPRFVKEGIESITRVLTEQQPNRDEYPQKLSDWTSSVNPKKMSLQQWLSTEMWPKVERYGLCYSLARRPSIGGANLKEQEQAFKDAGLPEVLLLIITPENLPWWETDELGQFTICRFTEEKTKPKLEDNYPVLEETFTRHWWITHEGWWWCDEPQAVTEATPLIVGDVGTWNTGGKAMKSFPVVKWGLKDNIGPTAAASLAQLAYFRKESELDVVETNSAFPQRVMPMSAGDEDPEEAISSTHTTIGYDPEGMGGAKPFILETTGVSLTHFAEKRLPDLEAEALAPYGRQREVGGNDSGVALAHIQETSKNLYRQHSKAGADSEFRGLQPVAELLGETLEPQQRAAWPRQFGTLSDSSQSEILVAFWELEPGDEFKKYILAKFADMSFELTADQLTEALDAWETAKQEQEQREQEQEEALFGQDGALKEAQAEKTRAEANAVGKPFAANPKSAAKPEKKG